MDEWTVRVCEVCFIRRTSEPCVWRDDVGMSLRVPMQLLGADPDWCRVCGEPTVVGIYMRVDPAEQSTGKGRVEPLI